MTNVTAFAAALIGGAARKKFGNTIIWVVTWIANRILTRIVIICEDECTHKSAEDQKDIGKMHRSLFSEISCFQQAYECVCACVRKRDRTLGCEMGWEGKWTESLHIALLYRLSLFLNTSYTASL